MSKIQKQNISLKMTAALAMLTAISIILGKYLAIPVGDVLRFSFENLPIIFAGIAFGAVPALLVGVTADIIGCILVGYGINPIVTLGAAVIGITSGFIPKLIRKHAKTGRIPLIILTVIIAHLFGSVIVKTFGLAAFYDMPMHLLLLWRLLNYAVVAVLEITILLILFNHDGIRREIEKNGLKSK